ncbi:MAG TPA: hypothetical protein VFV08_11605, partial [Puia sp.]|nr:hypothetical protein [Puia sp.]
TPKTRLVYLKSDSDYDYYQFHWSLKNESKHPARFPASYYNIAGAYFAKKNEGDTLNFQKFDNSQQISHYCELSDQFKTVATGRLFIDNNVIMPGVEYKNAVIIPVPTKLKFDVIITSSTFLQNMNYNDALNVDYIVDTIKYSSYAQIFGKERKDTIFDGNRIYVDNKIFSINIGENYLARTNSIINEP